MKFLLGLTVFGFVNTLKVDVYNVGDIVECSKEKCPSQYAACQKDSKHIQYCQNKCGTGTTCWKFCLLGVGDLSATNLAKCVAQNCVGYEQISGQKALMQIKDIDDECYYKYCSEQDADCLNDQKCYAVAYNCSSQCSDSSGEIDPICWKKCAVKAGNTKAVNLIQCTLDHNCWD